MRKSKGATNKELRAEGLYHVAERLHSLVAAMWEDHPLAGLRGLWQSLDTLATYFEECADTGLVPSIHAQGQLPLPEESGEPTDDADEVPF